MMASVLQKIIANSSWLMCKISYMKRLAIVILALLSLPSFAAPKSRSVGKPEAGANATVTVSCKGTVTDAVTGLPVAFATITAGKRFRATTDRLGTFSLKAVMALGDIDVTAARTGYHSSTVRITGSGTHELNFRMQGRPTTAIQKVDGTTVALDDDSVRFGYVLLFGSYQTATGNDFYLPDGTETTIPMAQVKRIIGPGVPVQTSSCPRPAQRVRLELRDGTTHDGTFVDSCYGYTVDLIGRDHVSGDGVFLPFDEVLEIVFP